MIPRTCVFVFAKLFILLHACEAYNFQCPSNGQHHLLPHETDCSKFYYCEYGVRRNDARNCPIGTLFSYDKQICDHAALVKCVTGDLPNGCPVDCTINRLLPHESDCGKYYCCVNGIKELRSCEEGKHFNAQLQVCDDPANAGCERESGGGESGSNCNNTCGNNNCNNTCGNNNCGGGNTGGGESGGCNNGTLPNGCPADFSIHLLLPHETDCTKFYQCTHGKKVLMPCAPGTHFNNKLQICDHPANAGCDSTCNGSGNTGGGGSNCSCGNNNCGGGNTGGGESGGCSNGTLPNGCPADFSIHLLLPHETDCTKFYQCTHGEKVLMPCAPGTHFNNKLQVCDHPANAGCDSTCNGSGNTGGGSNCSCGSSNCSCGNNNCSCGNNNCSCGNNNCGGGNTGGGESGGCNNGTLPNGCPADFSIHLLLPHETDCTKFYQCANGEKVLMPCAPGTHFNNKLQVCDHPANAGCDSTCSGGGNTGGGSNCSCGNSTCGGGNTGGGESGGCNNGTLPNGCPADFSIHLLLPHETDCTKFYQCANGEKVLMPCAPGTHFNNKLQVCDHPANAGCDSTCSGGGNTGGGSNCSCGNSTCGGGNTGGGESGGCNNGTLPNGCPADFSIHLLLPHETDCTKFYQCTHGKKVLMPCAPGTHFNNKLQVCDHPANAGCDPTCGCKEPEEESGGVEDDKCKDGTLPNGCPCDFCIARLLPHETDCDKYYCCVNGEKVLSSCASGLHFNAKLEKCDDPAAAGCAPVCSNNCKECHVPFWRHETDCSQFWRCVNGEEVLSVCPEGLAFNQDKQTCDFKCNVLCCQTNGRSKNFLLDAMKMREKSTHNNILNRIMNTAD